MDENRTQSQPRRKPRRRRRRRSGMVVSLLYVAFVIGISTLLATYGWTLANDVLALNKSEASATITLPDSIFEPYEETIEDEDEDGNVITKTIKGEQADMDYVAQQLEENGIVENKWLFKLFSTITKSGRKLRPGIYTLDTNMDYLAIVNGLGSTSTNRATVDVTFVEGSSVDQVFKLMEEKGVSTVAKLRDMAANHDYAFTFLQDIPLGDYRRLEGYLFPDTYTFYINEDPKYAINKMLINFDNRVTEEMRETIEQGDYSLREILTIASLIEKETDGTDKKTVSSVIHNRLKNTRYETAGFLQIDATLAYINGGKKPTEADKELDSPYNTYMYAGLPAGPIANPGLASIRAALEPESTNYYYYVLNPNTNRHEYSRTYEGHMKLVRKYAKS